MSDLIVLKADQKGLGPASWWIWFNDIVHSFIINNIQILSRILLNGIMKRSRWKWALLGVSSISTYAYFCLRRIFRGLCTGFCCLLSWVWVLSPEVNTFFLIFSSTFDLQTVWLPYLNVLCLRFSPKDSTFPQSIHNFPRVHFQVWQF